MNPCVPTKDHSNVELQEMLHAARRTLLRIEGKAPRAAGFDPLYDLWQPYPEALTMVAFKIALELRRRNVRAELAFFALRVPKQTFDIPEWI